MRIRLKIKSLWSLCRYLIYFPCGHIICGHNDAMSLFGRGFREMVSINMFDLISGPRDDMAAHLHNSNMRQLKSLFVSDGVLIATRQTWSNEFEIQIVPTDCAPK